jgi:RNA polymerase sporulation-specific sigma factor
MHRVKGMAPRADFAGEKGVRGGMKQRRQAGSSRSVRAAINPQVHADSSDYSLVQAYRRGDTTALDALMARYHQFVRLKASSYFLAGGDAEDLVQEGLLGLYKAVRDYRDDRLASFRSFAELCITRQIITAIKTATRQKHVPLNGYLSFSHTPGDAGDDSDCSLADVLPGSSVHDPVNQVISSEEVEALKNCLTRLLSNLESRVLRLYLQGLSYECIGNELDCDCKTVDNALQRIKRKVDLHLESRKVLQ